MRLVFENILFNGHKQEKTVSTQNIKISLVLNVKLRGFEEVFIWTQKLNSELFNYSCVH